MMKSILHKHLAVLDTTQVRVIDPKIPNYAYCQLDLSVKNKTLQSVDLSSSQALEAFIDTFIQKQNAQVAYGGYLEKRNIYRRSAYFNEKTDSAHERNIHLGVDIWSCAGTSVHAALQGEVHSFANNTNFGDYGPTIILKHRIGDLEFHTLYGHLSLESIENLAVGDKISRLQQIGTLGKAEVNGDYPPHLHFQIILDIGDYLGDYPGVCSANDLSYYRSNCPDPKLLLEKV